MGMSFTPEQRRRLGIRPDRRHSVIPAGARLSLPGMKPSDKDRLTRIFTQKWATLRGPALEAEVQFCKDRRFRFDFAHRDSKVAIELHGGIWTQGRHTRGAGFANDRTKMNIAQELGWSVYELTSVQLQDSQNLERVIQAIYGRQDMRRNGR